MSDTDPYAKRPRRSRRAPRTHEEAAKFAAWAMFMIGQGKLSADEGKTIVALLKEYRAAHDADFAIKRVALLEAKLNQQTPNGTSQ